MYKILVANGVNLDLLGTRPQSIYGHRNLSDLQNYVFKEVNILQETLDSKIDLTFFQSNEEHSFLQKISEGWDGAVLNPAAWTHTSLALADRLEALQLPFVEVHLSQLARRESFRQHSYSSKHAVGVIYGFGFDSYILGLHAILRHLRSK